MSEALVVGTVALDTVETPHGKADDALGGSASYGSVAASYFAPSSLLAVVGRDFPQKYVREFEKRGINLDGLEHAAGETFRWSGYYERHMAAARTNTTLLNVFQHFRPDLSPRHARIPYVFVANMDPEIQLHVMKQLKDTKFVALDTMNFWIEGSKKNLTKAIKRSTLLLMNEDEARQYCETTNLIEAAAALLKLGPHSVAIKKGEHGALVFQKSGVYCIPAYPLKKLKDPTGAGDTFAGSVVGYLAGVNSISEQNIRRSLAVGTVMASFVVEDFSLNRLTRIRPGEIHQRVEKLLSMLDIPELPRKSLGKQT